MKVVVNVVLFVLIVSGSFSLSACNRTNSAPTEFAVKVSKKSSSESKPSQTQTANRLVWIKGRDFETKDVTATGATFVWNKVPGAVAYEVHIDGVCFEKTRECSIRVGYFMPDTEYDVSIKVLYE